MDGPFLNLILFSTLFQKIQNLNYFKEYPRMVNNTNVCEIVPFDIFLKSMNLFLCLEQQDQYCKERSLRTYGRQSVSQK